MTQDVVAPKQRPSLEVLRRRARLKFNYLSIPFSDLSAAKDYAANGSLRQRCPGATRAGSGEAAGVVDREQRQSDGHDCRPGRQLRGAEAASPVALLGAPVLSLSRCPDSEVPRAGGAGWTLRKPRCGRRAATIARAATTHPKRMWSLQTSEDCSYWREERGVVECCCGRSTSQCRQHSRHTSSGYTSTRPASSQTCRKKVR